MPLLPWECTAQTPYSNQEENPVIDWGDIWWTNKKKHRNKGNGKFFSVKLEKALQKVMTVSTPVV